MIFLRILFFNLLIGLSVTSHSFEAGASLKRHTLLNEVQIYVDHSRKADVQQIMSHPERFNFQSTTLLKSEINFGFSDAVYWVRIPLSRQPSALPNWVLEIPYLGLDEVYFYAPGREVVTSGANAPVESRLFSYRYYAFPIVLTDQVQDFYLRVESSYAITIPLVLYSTSEFTHEQVGDALIQAMYYGGLLSLLFYNLILFLTVKDRQYLIYCLFTGYTGLGVFAGNGYARLYFWPDAIAWDRISQNTLLSIAGALAMIFTATFLKTRQHQFRFHLVLYFLAAAYLTLAFAFFISLFSDLILRSLVFELLFGITLISAVACLYGSYIAIKQGQASAYYFALAWGALASGASIAALRVFELVPSNTFTLYAFQIGSGFEMLLFSFALANRIQSERLLREQAQSEALHAKQTALEAMKVSENRLEQAVEERTEKLQELLISEQEIHDQYVRFGAMIAHEFRNPLNIIEGQTSLLELESESGINNTEKRATAIRSAIARLASLFDQWLQSDRLSQPGVQLEISTINMMAMLEDLVNSSRTFHPDFQFIFNPAMENVVIQADNHLLQIAILNLLDNACKYSLPKSKITIDLILHDDEIAISVTDEGCGIEEKDLQKIFDVYYRSSSKYKIKGVGLGLAFVKKITELHGGRTKVDSQSKVGSTFTIILPR